MMRNWLFQRMWRFKLWRKRPTLCKFGFHKTDIWNNGRNPGSNVLDLYCTECEKHVASRHREDFSGEKRKVVDHILDEVLQ